MIKKLEISYPSAASNYGTYEGSINNLALKINQIIDRVNKLTQEEENRMNNEELLQKLLDVKDILTRTKNHRLGCLTSCTCCAYCDFRQYINNGCYEMKGIQLALKELEDIEK